MFATLPAGLDVLRQGGPGEEDPAEAEEEAAHQPPGAWYEMR